MEEMTGKGLGTEGYKHVLNDQIVVAMAIKVFLRVFKSTSLRAKVVNKGRCLKEWVKDACMIT